MLIGRTGRAAPAVRERERGEEIEIERESLEIPETCPHVLVVVGGGGRVRPSENHQTSSQGKCFG